MPWDPLQYHKFRRERFQPFDDLLSLVRITEGLDVLDLGCGTGELTAILADRLPGSRVVGIDSSPQMLSETGKLERPGLSFMAGEVESVSGEWDLIFSNAVLHWVVDHQRLIPRLISLLRPKGQLAVQIPSNHRHPSHTTIIETVGEEPFKSALGGWVRHSPVLEAETYAGLLHCHGLHDITVLEKVYLHELPDADGVAEWTAGTTLIPYFERLPRELHQRFLERYREKLRHTWPTGPVLYTFRRILFAGRLA